MSATSQDPLQSPEAIEAQRAMAAFKNRVTKVDQDALDILFREARSHNGWLDKAVPDELLKELYDIVRWGSTSMNCCPARFTFIRSEDAKARLGPTLMPGNVDKVLAAPVTVIIAHDLEFYTRMPELFPHRDVSPLFCDNAPFAATTAFRNGTLQGAYLIMAARALGLDCGPMSGFDNDKLDREFFPGTNLKSNFICSLGYGDTSKVFPRLPRLDFSAACELI